MECDKGILQIKFPEKCMQTTDYYLVEIHNNPLWPNQSRLPRLNSIVLPLHEIASSIQDITCYIWSEKNATLTKFGHLSLHLTPDKCINTKGQLYENVLQITKINLMSKSTDIIINFLSTKHFAGAVKVVKCILMQFFKSLELVWGCS